MLKISETFILGYDSSNGEDLSELSVVSASGQNLTHVNTFYGEEADWMYNRLKNKINLKGERTDEQNSNG